MKTFFEAKKIAVIGASRERGKVGNVIFRNLLETGEKARLRVFPVNPNADYVESRKAYPDVLSIPFPVDMAVIVVPAKIVPSVLEDCGKKEIRNVIIISSGFGENGNLELNEKILSIAREYKIKIIGPNVLGILSPYKNLNATFFREMPEKGNVSFISQSGAIGTAVLDMAVETKLGFSSFISLGNMLGEDFLDALEYLEKDIYTEVIMLYIESLKENTGKEFVEICKRISKRKRIIALKAGKTKEGIETAKTHTASLSSSSLIYSGAFKQSSIIEADSLEELFNLAEIFSKYKKLGKNACIITNAGGLGVLAADNCVKSGIKLGEIPEKVLFELDKVMPSGYSRRNPLDILGDALAERYEKVLKILMKYNLFDFYIVILTPQQMTQPLETARVLTAYKKPVIACYIGGKSLEEAKMFLRHNNVVVFDDDSDILSLGKAI